jgi:hypothetical protein
MLSYLLCVLMPSVAFALPGHHTMVDCLVGGQMSNAAAIPAPVRSAELPHIGRHLHMHGDRTMTSMPGQEHSHGSVPKHSTSQCCALMNVPALPATVIDFHSPLSVVAVRCIDRAVWIAEDPVHTLYRPPIG